VADTFNSRILRFPPNAKNANLVLGQSSFSDVGCVPNGPLNRMCTPTLARVHPTTGELYVLDEYPAPFFARLLVFRPPFTNGMTAYKTIIPNQDGPFTNWEGWDGTGAYRFQSTGFIFNTYKQGEYANGEIWLNEHSANRTLLIDFDGNIVKVIGAQSQFLRGGDSVYYPACGSIEEGNRLVWPGGSIGMDNANNIYLADEGFQTVYRYDLPYNTHQVGGVTCLPDANGVLFPKGPNHRSSARLGESVGMVVAGNQLLVRDEGMRLKVYNDYQMMPFGANATFELAGGLQGRNWLSGGVDDSNRLWLSGEHGQIRIYQLPLASQSPIADFVRLYWADTGLEVTRPDGSDYVQVGAMAFDSIQQAMYIADALGTRIFRVKNYDQFADKLLVDMVIGQRNKTEVRCNQGLSSPNAETLCLATQIKFDTLGNLFVVDNAYECQGNRRIVVFEAGTLNGATTLFPRLGASKVFNAAGLNAVGNCAYWTVNIPGSPVSLAFNSKNQMVVGNDGYYGDASQRQLKQLWFYSDPLAKQTPDASIEMYMGTPGELDFDENDNLLIQDHTWYKVWMINLGCDPEWLSYLPEATIPVLPACGEGDPVSVTIGGEVRGVYALTPNESSRVSYPGVNRGPVQIENSQAAPVIGAERVIYRVNNVNTSFSEMMGMPAGQLNTTYWLPWYNNVNLDTQLRIANVSGSQATVTVTIGGVPQTTFNLAAGASTRVSYAGVNSGPVKIVSTQIIVAAERVIYKVNGVNTSFTEMMALPGQQLDNVYYLPWYNNVDLDTQLRIANVSGFQATVTVTIGGVPQPSFNLAAGASTRVSYPMNNGPVKIVSTQDIVAAERVIYKVNGKNTSFSEMMALPENCLDNTYWLPWYNNADLDTQLRIANVSASQATVTVTIGGVPQPSFNLAAGASTRISYPANNGPVKIVSTQNIVAAERVIYKVNNVNTSFTEMMALPNSQLDTTYWLPWYNNVDLDTQLRFGVP
jgi:sugar lactone lactonase YvrE